MKKFHLYKGLLFLFFISLLINACQKEQSPLPLSELSFNNVSERSGGVLADDPAAVNRVPMIVSKEFLAKNSAVLSSFFIEPSYRGKPIRIIADITAPTVSITSPSNSATVTGAIYVTVNASDNVGVKTVNLSVDGIAVVSSIVSPFIITWNSATVANGTHTLSVTAIDAAGNKSTSSILVTVNNVLPGDITLPTVSLSSPTDQSSVTGTVNVIMSASDNVGISSVSISIDNTVVSTSTNYSWNTANSPSGVHLVTAIAKDAAGNQGTKTVSVTINTVVVNPPLSSAFQLAMPPVGAQGSEGSCVAFAIGYAARSAEYYYRSGATSYSYVTNIFSPEFLYNQTKFSSDCGSGTSMQIALDFIAANGISSFQSMPYSSTNGCSLLPTDVQKNEAFNYKIAGYSKIYYTDRSAIKSMLEQKHPVIITILADNSFVNAKLGFIWKVYSGSGMLPHSIVLCGYDNSKNAYKVMNSWGTAWGDAGFSWIDFDFFETGGKIAGGGNCYVIN